MPVYRPRRFAKLEILQQIDPQLLARFLNAFRADLVVCEVDLTEPFSDYETLSAVLMNPSGGSVQLADTLYLINEMATLEAMDLLLPALRADGFPFSGRDPTPPEVALSAWLASPELLERLHAECFVTRRRSFQYFLPAVSPLPSFETPSEETLAALATALDARFVERFRGRGCRVLCFPGNLNITLVVHHGEPLRREGTLDDGERSAVLYRPEKFDVLLYGRSSGVLGINAPSKWQKDLYRQQFALHLFGVPNLFRVQGRYILEPLRTNGRDALSCDDIDGLDSVTLTEIRFMWGGAVTEVETRQADDLFEVYREGRLSFPQRPPIIRAKFALQFTDNRPKRSLTITPPDKAEYTREGDQEVLEEWMRRRGFWAEPSDA